LKTCSFVTVACLALALAACQVPEGTPLAPTPVGAAGDAGTTGVSPSGQAQASAAPAAGPVEPASSGFDVNVNGFKFENYGNDTGVENLTPTEMQRLFGDGVFAGGGALTPPAQKWMDETNQGMSGGHCEGMAVLSLLLYQGQRKVSDFGAEKASDLALQGNPGLQHEIAYWFALQALDPTAGAETKDLTPNQVLARLAEGLKPGAKDTYTLGFYKRGYKEGHAVMPYAITDAGGGVRKILIYDNNYPGVPKELTVDTATEKWSYDGSTNPSVAGSTYEGDADSKTLTITPISERLKPQKAPFVGDSADVASADQQRQVFLQGEADALIDNGSGQVGTKGGVPVNTIPGAKQLEFKSAFNNQRKNVFDVPGATDLTVTLGGGISGKSSEELSMVGPGYDLGIEDITLEPNQVDKVTMSANGRVITYTTTARETPELTLGVQTPGADWAFVITAGGDEDGHTVRLELDPATGKLGISTDGVSGASGFDVLVYRIDDQGSHEYKNFGNQLEEGQDVWLDYGSWTGVGPMTFEVDTNGDHKPDASLQLADETP
jgi:hypothetical protein